MVCIKSTECSCVVRLVYVVCSGFNLDYCAYVLCCETEPDVVQRRHAHGCIQSVLGWNIMQDLRERYPGLCIIYAAQWGY